MARVSPLLKLHQQAEASLISYAAPVAKSEASPSAAGGEGGAAADDAVQLVETFGELELEYAALRKGAVLLDRPQRGTIEVTGADRLEFLNRMLTQELKGLGAYQTRRSFWLNRKGRIDADLRVIELEGRTLLDVDVHALRRTMDGLNAFIITEDVALRDLTERTHRLALHGPTGPALVAAVSTHLSGSPISDLAPGRACVVAIAGEEVVIDRDDSAGEIGLELTLPAESAVAVYQQLIEVGQEHDGSNGGSNGSEPASRFRLRPAGWHAYNIARIEAGTLLYYIDFGPDSLPHQAGEMLRDRVSFTKGCYLGQEIVARMESRGNSKPRLVALRFEGAERASGGYLAARLPVAGALVTPVEGPMEGEADPVGAVTSSTLSPMLGGEAICFAMVKRDHTEPGARLRVVADDGGTIVGLVQPRLAFWKK